MKFFLKRFFKRTLRVDILFLFLTLFSCSFIILISFSFYKNRRSFRDFAISIIENIGQIVLEKIETLVVNAEQVPLIASNLFNKIEDVSLDNKYLLPFIMNAIEYDGNFSGFYIGTKEGNYIGADNIVLSGQKYYVSNPSIPLPSDIRYMVFEVNNTSIPPTQIVYYKDQDFQPICTENVPKSLFSFDPRNRPWYFTQTTTKTFKWSDIYRFYRSGQLGVSVSLPLFSDEQELFGSVGVDLSIEMLSRFLGEQKIGRSGKAFILDDQGKILVSPMMRSSDPSLIDAQFVQRSYELYDKEKSSSFLIKHKGIKYLVAIQPLSLSGNRRWLICTIAPLSDFFSQILQTRRLVLTIVLSILFIIGWLIFLTSKRISAPIVKLAREVNKITQLELSSELRIASNIKEIQIIDASIAKLRNIMRSFALYVPRNIVKMLLSLGEEIAIGGEKKEISVFFSDISGFTSVAESRSVEFILDLLSEYFEGLSNIILDQEGVIDKYIGDSVMAFWGAPLSLPNHASKACRAALLCQSYLKEFNKEQREKQGQELITRIAINSGEAIVGNIGSDQRMNYTVIGDVVNIAAHLQSINKVYHTHINITEETYKRVKNEFIGRPLDIVEVKGRKEKMKIYELVAAYQGEKSICATRDQVQLCTLFTEGYEAFHGGDLKKAREIFENLSTEFPNDYPTHIYLNRLKAKKL